ncbi:MAG: CdvA-like protein, partial [Candidatus Nitrosopelagicus sp.]|nr:CdvA-like protein [Candidatus Nitrosopelagicus sp.]
GINCGSEGLKQIPHEQLVAKSEVVIFIPKWRLDSQRLLKEKELTVRPLTALMEIVSDNDTMKSDAELIHEKNRTKLMTLQNTEEEINSELEQRVAEINAQMKAVKVLLFDAKVQYKSNEISQETFNHVQTETDGMLQHMNYEKDEISKVKSRLTNLSIEDVLTTGPALHPIQDSAVTYLTNPNECEPVESRLPEPPGTESSDSEQVHNPPMTIPQQDSPKNEEPAEEKKFSESDWLKRMTQD